jgi:hypothetical protein
MVEPARFAGWPSQTGTWDAVSGHRRRKDIGRRHAPAVFAFEQGQYITAGVAISSKAITAGVAMAPIQSRQEFGDRERGFSLLVQSAKVRLQPSDARKRVLILQDHRYFFSGEAGAAA